MIFVIISLALVLFTIIISIYGIYDIKKRKKEFKETNEKLENEYKLYIAEEKRKNDLELEKIQNEMSKANKPEEKITDDIIELSRTFDNTISSFDWWKQKNYPNISRYEPEYPYSVANGAIGITSVIFIILLIFVIYINSGKNRRNERRYLNNKIANINANRSILLANEDMQLNLVEIVEYNETVTEYKNQIARTKENLKSPWCNWFNCSIYNDYTGDEVQYITQTDFS